MIQTNEKKQKISAAEKQKILFNKQRKAFEDCFISAPHRTSRRLVAAADIFQNLPNKESAASNLDRVKMAGLACLLAPENKVYSSRLRSMLARMESDEDQEAVIEYIHGYVDSLNQERSLSEGRTHFHKDVLDNLHILVRQASVKSVKKPIHKPIVQEEKAALTEKKIEELKIYADNLSARAMGINTRAERAAKAEKLNADFRRVVGDLDTFSKARISLQIAYIDPENESLTNQAAGYMNAMIKQGPSHEAELDMLKKEAAVMTSCVTSKTPFRRAFEDSSFANP